MAVVIYRNLESMKDKQSWIRHLSYRIDSNQNNLICVTGKTGSGKTWSAISICEMLSERMNVPFGIDNIVFTLKDLMALINSDKLVKGSCIIFDEPQVSISAREFQSQANRVFNYLLTTFRHKNLNLFFCTPYEDLLDKTARKLFHAKFTTQSINRNRKIVRIHPVEVQYNAHLEKFYEKTLRIVFKPEGKKRNIIRKLMYWDIPKPSDELVELYEIKKKNFTRDLNIKIQNKLEQYEKKDILDPRLILTKPQIEALELMIKYDGNKDKVREVLGINASSVNLRLKKAKNKGYTPEIYRESLVNR